MRHCRYSTPTWERATTERVMPRGLAGNHTAVNARNPFWFAARLLTARAAGFVLAPLVTPAQRLPERVRGAKWPRLALSLVIPLGLGPCTRS
jgi:hypothetical protein